MVSFSALISELSLLYLPTRDFLLAISSCVHLIKKNESDEFNKQIHKKFEKIIRELGIVQKIYFSESLIPFGNGHGLNLSFLGGPEIETPKGLFETDQDAYTFTIKKEMTQIKWCVKPIVYGCSSLICLPLLLFASMEHFKNYRSTHMILIVYIAILIVNFILRLAIFTITGATLSEKLKDKAVKFCTVEELKGGRRLMIAFQQAENHYKNLPNNHLPTPYETALRWRDNADDRLTVQTLRFNLIRIERELRLRKVATSELDSKAEQHKIERIKKLYILLKSLDPKFRNDMDDLRLF